MKESEKQQVLDIIDEVMNNREIDSIRNAILAIRDKVKELKCEDDFWSQWHAKLPLRGGELNCVGEYYEGAKFVVIDTFTKLDTGIYGEYYYTSE